MQILSVHDAAFAPYGRILQGYPLKGLMEVVSALPVGDKICYQAREERLHLAPDAEKCGDMFLGGMPFQLGYCTGKSTRLDAMAFHRSSELLCGAQDFILLLALAGELENGFLSTDRVRSFRVPRGDAVELYGGVLHALACPTPCDSLRVLILQPYATNSAYRTTDEANNVDRTLWARNTWLLAHRESAAAAQGAFVALQGENIDLAKK